MKIAVIGSGYVGLVTGACFADLGVDVVCVDSNTDKVQRLQRGEIPIYEPGLNTMVEQAVANERLQFTTDIAQAVAGRSIVFIAVGTPSSEDGSADLGHVLQAAQAIGQTIDGFTVVVDKSTVPVGTADRVHAVIARQLQERGVQHAFVVASNPEFLKEGAAIDDFMRPDRVVLGLPPGELGLKARALLDDLYAPLTRNHQRTLYMDVRSAELTKYAANAMLATRISFMNELANLAEKLGADIESVRRGIGSDPRIGYDFLYAGAGYGGSCFPKDVKALIKTASVEAGIDLKVLHAVEAANDQQKHVLGHKIKARFGADLTGKHFALWGLAFKANTDDMREATSREVIKDLLAAGASVTAYDPVAMPEARHCFPNEPGLRYADNQSAALAGADALVIVTEWKEFRSPDFDNLKAQLKAPIIFDGRNLYDPKMVRDIGFEYWAIGR